MARLKLINVFYYRKIISRSYKTIIWNWLKRYLIILILIYVHTFILES